MASTYLTRTNGTPTNVQKYTFSAWVKRAGLGARQRIITGLDPASTGEYSFIEFTSGDLLGINNYDGTSGSGIEKATNRVFRDTSAWYHIVVAVDSTQATATDRLKIYVNGVQETSFNYENPGVQNQDLALVKSGKTVYVGQHGTVGFYFNGEMAHVHLIDGTVYDASAFGQTDTASGIWKPKTAPSVTYGTNGFFLKFANSGSLGTDSSGNGNNFTVNGSGTQTLDTPSNVFATLNPLDFGNGSTVNANLTLGNTKALSSAASWKHSHGTLGVSKGKWYFEAKASAVADSDTGLLMGWCDPTYPTDDDPNTGAPGTKLYSLQSRTFYEPSGKTDDFFPALSANDIIMSALDLDNGKIWFGKNGTWYNTGGVAGSTANQASTIDVNNPDATGVVVDTSRAGVYVPHTASYNDGFYLFNFGNGYFGTSPVASGNADGDGYGIFEYAPPTGYYALCTKNINTYG